MFFFMKKMCYTFDLKCIKFSLQKEKKEQTVAKAAVKMDKANKNQEVNVVSVLVAVDASAAVVVVEMVVAVDTTVVVVHVAVIVLVLAVMGKEL